MLEVKEVGNVVYKKCDFDIVIVNYDKVIELDFEDVLFLNNRAAVNLEKGDLDVCIVDCEFVIEKG